jgi:serine/threonine-protein kinase
VYEACHRNGKLVALKLLHPGLSLSERQRKRLLREAYVANTIGHPGVVQIHDDGVDADGTAYLVMELLAGETVGALAKQAGGCLPVAQVLDIANQLLDVLCAAHARRVVHRDIKPENVFMTKGGHVKVLDFGIARLFDPVPGTTVHTQDGIMLGTPAFMAQEQARGRWDEVDQRSDLWAVGATLFTLVTGELVHAAETSNEQLGKAMTMNARLLGELHPELPAPFTAAVDRALRFERTERWPDAASMREALREAWDESAFLASSERQSTAPVANVGGVAWQRITEGMSLLGLTAGDRRTRRRRLLGWTLAAGVLVSVVATVAMTNGRRGQVLAQAPRGELLLALPAGLTRAQVAAAAELAVDGSRSLPSVQPLASAATTTDSGSDSKPPSATAGPKTPAIWSHGSRDRAPASAPEPDSSRKPGTSHLSASPPDPLDRRR